MWFSESGLVALVRREPNMATNARAGSNAVRTGAGPARPYRTAPVCAHTQLPRLPRPRPALFVLHSTRLTVPMRHVWLAYLNRLNQPLHALVSVSLYTNVPFFIG